MAQPGLGEVTWRVGFAGSTRGGRLLTSEVVVTADDWRDLDREVRRELTVWFHFGTGDTRDPMQYAWATTMVPVSGGLAAMFEPSRFASPASTSRLGQLLGDDLR